MTSFNNHVAGSSQTSAANGSKPTSRPEYQFKGVYIPASIWRNRGITWIEKCLLAEIDALSKDGCCWASNAYLAEQMGIEAKSMSNMIGRLIKKNLIIHAGYDGFRRQLLLAQNAQSDPQIRPLPTPSAKGGDSIGQGIPLHPPMDHRLVVERTSIGARLNKVEQSQEIPLLHQAIQYLESHHPTSKTETVAEAFIVLFKKTPNGDWRKRLLAFARKVGTDVKRKPISVPAKQRDYTRL